MKKLINFIKSIFFSDASLYQYKKQRIEELHQEELRILDSYKDDNDLPITEIDKIKMDIIQLKIDNLCK